MKLKWKNMMGSCLCVSPCHRRDVLSPNHLHGEEEPGADARPHVVDPAEGVSAVLVGEVREGEHDEHDGEEGEGEGEGDEVKRHGADHGGD